MEVSKSLIEIFMFGILGFIGWEALRLYKVLARNQELSKMYSHPMYWLVILIMALLSGVFALLTGVSNPLAAIFVGFSVPAVLKALFSIKPSAGTKESKHEEAYGDRDAHR